MESKKQASAAAVDAPLLPEFKPASQLWDGPGSRFPSEQSARWALRKYGPELAKAEALAVHRGRIMVHPGRLAAVMERVAIDAAQRRWGVSNAT